MKIIYFTTAQNEVDYRSFIKNWKIALNPSNQNFHNKMIRALAIDNQVDVISIRPFSHSLMKIKKLPREEKTKDNITWHYLKRCGLKVRNMLQLVPEAKKAFKNIDTKNAIIITDTINQSVVHTLEKINKKYKLPVIGVCTDSPSNISGTKKSFTEYLLSHCSNYSGYIALTKALNKIYNPSSRPSYILEGIVEENEGSSLEENAKKYFFFGGALMPKYGVFNLIKAFKNLNDENVDLLICGHHGDKNKLRAEIGKNQNIKFLGLLPVNKVLEYERKSLAMINPRPFSEDLDRFSIPSKTLEYMSAGRPVISVKNTILKEKFPDEIIWVDSYEVHDLEAGLKQVLSMSEKERAKLGNDAKNRVLTLYSLKSVSTNINYFLKQFIS